MATFPDDADGAVLANLASQGVDLTRPMAIEFPVAAPDQASANAIGEALNKAGYAIQIEYDEGELDEDDVEFDPDDEEFGPSWTVVVNMCMIPEYKDIVRIQAELDRLAVPYGGNSDGWGVMLDDDANT